MWRYEILKIIFLLAQLQIGVSLSSASARNYLNVANNLVHTIKNSLAVYKVNLILNGYQTLPPVGTEIVRAFSQQTPASIIDSQKKAEDSTEEDILFSATYGRFILEKFNLAVIIVDEGSEISIYQKLEDILKSYGERVVGNHGKYLLLVTTDEQSSFEDIFRFAWSMNMLDLTIIEFPTNESEKSINANSVGNQSFSAGRVHQFNPFLDQYNQYPLTKTSNLFPNKLKNLNGYKFRVAVYGGTVYAFGTKILQELNSGYDFLLSQALMESLNSTMVLEPDSNNFKPWYMHPLDIGATYGEDLTDFWMTLNDQPIIVSDYPQEILEAARNMKFITLPTPNSLHLIVKRPYEDPEVRLSTEAIIAYVSLFLTGIFFALVARILGFKVENWSALNIMTAQMGGSLEYQDQNMKISAKIYLLMMYIVTFMVTDLLADQLIQIFIYYPKTISDFKTLAHLADSDLPLIMARDDVILLSKIQDNPSLMKILSRVEVRNTSYYGQATFCDTSAIFGSVDESINVCMWDSRSNLMKIETSDDYFINKIEEPVQVVYPLLHVRHNGFFRDRFELLLQRLFETGMDDFWRRTSRRDFVSYASRKSGDNDVIVNNKIPKKSDMEDATPSLNYQLSAIIVFGSVVSVIVLFCEIVCSHILDIREIRALIAAFNRC
ncbi:hypothetical protein QAD02_016775 [Eretmocerus hayati]|uniref:Uncharacterized protein n=1 Tax=Eretmocerus hayati TaxID=131215 RepID=A0ACC2PD27_9HYME|nr:hypothetical protein QAD02_016775 [Eretmocerus hayati]